MISEICFSSLIIITLNIYIYIYIYIYIFLAFFCSRNNCRNRTMFESFLSLTNKILGMKGGEKA